ncbi:MAG: response regulator transcription factor [Gammaproteobacteria bacterium]|nr:response regulator transcription factor [Gammaproteobacteria bacterium]
MHILLVEDDPLLGDGIRTALRRAGDSVDWLEDGKAALQALLTEPFDVVVLDLGLPRMDGLDVLRQARAKNVVCPILILTARDATRDRVAGLDAGADDYLTKPFELDELQARLRALHRRAQGRAEPELRHGELVLQVSAHTLSYQGRPVTLPRREFMVLQALLERAGRVLTREQLEQTLYGWGEDVESNAVEVHVHHLRKKLYPTLIRTVRGVGYTIDKSSH